jgi:hypothetical protein
MPLGNADEARWPLHSALRHKAGYLPLLSGNADEVRWRYAALCATTRPVNFKGLAQAFA